MSASKLPVSGSLRLAVISDAERLGLIATAGFFHSSWFEYKRPFYRTYVQDSVLSYTESYRKAISNPDSAVIVVEDTFRRDEDQHVFPELAKIYSDIDQGAHRETATDASTSVIVSAVSISFTNRSVLHGQFQPHDAGKAMKPVELQDRDASKRALAICDEVRKPRELLAFQNRTVIDRMVTHPAYWRRGHATQLVREVVKLAESDGSCVGMGVAAAPMGKELFIHLGFEEVEVVEVPGYKEHPDPVYAWLGVRDHSNKGDK